MSALPPEAVRDAHVFRRSLPMHIKLDRIVRAVGKTDGLTCLEIGMDNGMMSYHLRKTGGTWNTVATNESAAQSARALVEDNVHVLKKDTLPFKKKVFDVVVAIDMLGRVENSDAFIAECHRMLKPDGRLALTAVNRKKATLIRPLRALLGGSREKGGVPHTGFTESELFVMLKDGFDVHGINKFRRFFVEFTDLCVQALVRRASARGEHTERKVMRVYSWAAPFYFVAAQLDMLLFLTRGHYLIAIAQRRAWLPRKTPILTDGRTISEAVLSSIPG